MCLCVYVKSTKSEPPWRDHGKSFDDVKKSVARSIKGFTIHFTGIQR